MPTQSREIRLRERPTGVPTEDLFDLAESTLADPGDGEFLVRNIWMSVDPYMRGRMTDRRSYIAPFEPGKPLEGGAIGQVVASKNPKYPVGTYVNSMLGWREFYVSAGRGVERIDPSVAPIQAYLGVLGAPGLTAYVGLLKVAALQAGETVFVSGAAGAVGSVVCQIAKAKDCRVVASAGSHEKLEWLRHEARVDHAFNYKTSPDLSKELAQGAPNGIDVYFENVGGPQLEVALLHMRDFGRVAICGWISQYNATSPEPGPSTLPMAIPRRLRLEGFIVTDHLDQRPAFFADMKQWIAAGKIKWQETVFEGLEKAPRAFIGLFQGQNIGKMLVRIGAD